MKVLLSVLMFVYSVSAVELRSFIPLHFSCVAPVVDTDYGVVKARLDVFRKGIEFTAQLILSKDNTFLTGFKQLSSAHSENGIVSFAPQGQALQIGQEGTQRPLQDTIVITQSPNKNIQVRFTTQNNPYITYHPTNCR